MPQNPTGLKATQEEPVSLTGGETLYSQDEAVRKALSTESSSIQYHMPFHNYMGPGTHIVTNLQEGIQPTTTMDRAAMIHDIEYVKPNNQWRADNNMWLNSVKEQPYLLPLHNMVRAAFLAKDLVGYKTKTDDKLYSVLKKKAETDYDLGGMGFADTEYGVWGL